MEDLLNYIICDIFDIPNFYLKEEIIKQITFDNIFGVFVTVKRSINDELQQFPNNIHGCIGKYKLDFKPLNSQEIIDSIIQSARSAIFNDTRKNYFKDIKYDPSALIEITLMKSPLLDVENNFNNEEKGIIIYNESQTKTATFLPNVFDKSVNLTEIKDNLYEKSNINKTEKAYFKCYDTDKYNKKIINILNKNYINKTFNKISIFFNNYYKNKLPYAIQNNNILTNDDDDIRNIATLKDLTDMNNKCNCLNISTLKTIENDITNYDKKYNENNIKIKQALSFLSIISKKQENINSICLYLVKNINSMEKTFELGQALIALVKCGQKEIVEKNLNLMFDELNNKKDIDINDIFRINWQTKALFSYNTDNKEHTQLLIHILIDIMPINILTNLETNYLAVAFECISTIYKYIKDNNKLNILLFNIFCILQRRFSIYGIYMFSDNTARIDITGHIIQGFLNYE